MGLTEAPSHVWNTVGFIVYMAALVTISIIGIVTGNPQALWVWLLFALTGWESQCECHECTGRVPAEERESAGEILARKYAEGEISEAELDEQLDTVEQIRDADDEAEELLETR